MNLCSCSKRIAATFNSFLQILLFFGLAKNQASFVQDRVKISVPFPDLTSKTDLHRINPFICKHACKVDCDVNSGIDPLPF